MGIGALLIGLAALIVVVAYVTVPFQRNSRGEDVDAQIEAWIAAAAVDITAETGDITTKTGKSGNYCPQCGEPVQPNYRFCRNCGTRLVSDAPLVTDDN